jgi:tRNA-specific 2-thiouridylase
MKIAVGMSGGMDSSVAAMLLKEQGYDVIGLTMEVWGSDPGDSGSVVKNVARELGIQHYSLDLREAFENEVVGYFIREYVHGRTPNPCVVCNEKMKLGLLLERARELGVERLATGHYARVDTDLGCVRLRRGKDRDKDQSYFLSTLSRRSLEKAMFPLGGYTKEEVRTRSSELPVRKKESQDLCFIPDGDYAEFIRQRHKPEEGVITDKEGKIMGHHRGIVNYTIGQRSGIGIPRSSPFYVIDIDSCKNTVVVGDEEDLFCKSFAVRNLNWTGMDSLEKQFDCEVQVRYRSQAVQAVLSPAGEIVQVELKTAQKSVTPGQLAVFYEKDTVLGAGWIDRRQALSQSRVK